MRESMGIILRGHFRGVILEGHFLGPFGGHFARVLSRYLIVFNINSGDDIATNISDNTVEEAP